MTRFLPAYGLALIVSLSACGGAGSSLHAGTMPSGGSWTGVWQSPQYGDMHLCQNGQQVTGDYVKNERHGTMQGTVQGDLLRFSWEERRELVQGRPVITRGHGYFRYTIGDDQDHYFRGEWGIDDAYDGGGPWNAVRMRNRQPTRCLGRHDDADTSSGGDSYGDDSYGDDSSGGDDYSGGNEAQDDDLAGLDEY